jgi:orotate phosphoribosyltransferase
MAVMGFEDIERKIWEEEKRYLMKHISLSLVRGKALKIGDYTLTSGKKSPYYVDLRQSISDPIAMDWIANALARIVASEIGRAKVDKIMGVPTAGVPFATLVSQKLAIPMLYYRKERKEHGVRKKIEGDMERNDAYNIELHLLFSISEAFGWVRGYTCSAIRITKSSGKLSMQRGMEGFLF